MEIENEQKEEVKKDESLKSKKVIDPEKYKVEINTCKFIEIYPQPITCLSYSSAKQLLAVGRQDSSVEIWSTTNWTQLMKYQLNKFEQPTNIQLVDQDKYLITFSLNGTILLFSLSDLFPIYYTNTNGGQVWDICTQENTELILTANNDGYVRVYQKEEDNTVQCVRTVTSYNSICVSVCWEYYGKNEFFSSYTDGVIRKFNSQGNVAVAMIVKEKINNNEVFAWRVLSIKDELLIAGCNNGQVLIFESNFGTQIKSFQRHEADIKSLLYNEKYNTVYATGSDSRIIAIQKISETSNEWDFSSQERGQSHDISTLSLLNSNQIISAGVTTDLCIYNLQNGQFINGSTYSSKQDSSSLKKYPKKSFKHIGGLPQIDNFMSVSEVTNLIVVKKAFSVEIWQFDLSNHQYKFFSEYKSDKGIICACIHPLGSLMAFSTTVETLIFKINSDKSLEKIMELEPCKNLLFTSKKHIQLYYINKNDSLCLLTIKNKKSQVITKLNSALKNSQHMLFGYKEKSIIIASKMNNVITEYQLPDIQKKLEVKEFVLESPFEKSCFTALKYYQLTNQLICAFDNRKIALFDMNEKRLGKWSRDNLIKYPDPIIHKKVPIHTILIHPNLSKRLILVSHYYLIVVNLRNKVPSTTIIYKNEQLNEQGKKKNFSIIELKNPVYYAQELHMSSSLLICETNFNQMVEYLPDPIKSKKFVQ